MTLVMDNALCLTSEEFAEFAQDWNLPILLDVKESPDKIFFGWSLHTNLPRPGMVHSGYEDRYINKEATGMVPSTRNFVV